MYWLNGSIVWLKLISSWVTHTFSLKKNCFCEGTTKSIGPSQFFGSIVHFSIEATLWTPVAKYTQICSHWPTFSVYIHESWTLGKPYGIKLRCNCKRLKEQFENLRNPLRTWWEHIRNRGEKNKKITPPTHPTPPRKEKTWAHHEDMLSLLIGCMKFLFFQKRWSSFLAWANGRCRILGTYSDSY